METTLSVFEIRSFIRGYYEYQDRWSRTLNLQREPNNPVDRHAVAIKKDNDIVGHAPYNISPTVSAFLNIHVGINSGFAEVTGLKVNRGGRYGLEIPCIYRFYGPKVYLERLELALRDKGQ